MHRLVQSFAVLSLLSPSIARAADVILNEYNAVASNKWLGNPNLPECVGPAGFDCSIKEDTFFGRVMGNGGNWFELVVITDHLDMRGWSMPWEEVGNAKVGTIFLSEDVLWSDLRAGTIITFTELTTAEGGLDTDTSFDPCNGDWWININSFDTTYVPKTTTNVPGMTAMAKLVSVAMGEGLPLMTCSVAVSGTSSRRSLAVVAGILSAVPAGRADRAGHLVGKIWK